MTTPLDILIALASAVVAVAGAWEMVTLRFFNNEPPRVRREWRG